MWATDRRKCCQMAGNGRLELVAPTITIRFALWRHRQSNSLPPLSAAGKAGSAAGSVRQPTADLRQPAGSCRQLPGWLRLAKLANLANLERAKGNVFQ